MIASMQPELAAFSLRLQSEGEHPIASQMHTSAAMNLRLCLTLPRYRVAVKTSFDTLPASQIPHVHVDGTTRNCKLCKIKR